MTTINRIVKRTFKICDLPASMIEHLVSMIHINPIDVATKHISISRDCQKTYMFSSVDTKTKNTSIKK